VAAERVRDRLTCGDVVRGASGAPWHLDPLQRDRRTA
jgi:hypothetical protein